MKPPYTVVVIEATDWAMNYAQLDIDTDFRPIRGLICGLLVKETKKHITLTQQYFMVKNQARQTITIPKCNIKHRADLELREKK